MHQGRSDADGKRLQANLAKAQEIERETQQNARTHGDRVKQMMEVLHVGSLIGVAGKLRDIKERAELETQAAEAVREMLAAVGAGTLAEAHAALDGQSGPLLVGEEAVLAAYIQDVEDRTHNLFAA